MKNLIAKKSFIKIGIALSIVFICILIEVLFFNSTYFTIQKNERGLVNLDKNHLILHDMRLNGTKFDIIGKKPYFEIPGTTYISSLRLYLSPDTDDFNIYSDSSKGPIYAKTDIALKNYTFIDVNNKVTNAKFYITANKNIKSIGIDSLIIDNKFYFNIIRFLLILSVSILTVFFIFYRQLSKQKLHITFIIIVLTLGTIISLSVPPYFSYDEKEHFVKSYETASLDLGFSHNEPIGWVSNIDDFFKFNGHFDQFSSYKERLQYSKALFTRNYSTNKKFYTSTAQTYLFVAYIPSAIGIFLGKLLKLPFILTFYLGRFFSLLSYAILGSLIIKKVNFSKRLIFMTLLLPGVVLTAGSYSVDPATNIFALGAVSIFINMLCSKDESINFKKLAGFAGCIAITVMCKPTYAPLCILIFAVPITKFKNHKNINKWFVRLPILVFTAFVSSMTYLYASKRNMNQWAQTGVNVNAQISYIIHHFATYLHTVYNFVAGSIITYFEGSSTLLAYCGSLDQIWFLIILISLFVLAIADNESDILKLTIKDKALLFLSIILSWGLVVSALYLTFTPVASKSIDGVQGRYFLPLFLPFFLLFKNTKISNNFKKENLNYVVSIGCALMLFGTAVKLFLQYSN